MGVLNVSNSSGAIIYSEDPEYQPGRTGYIGGGGMGGGGVIWSDSEQIIYISVNNAPKYPIHLKPGNNNVKFWIPYIFPKDEWVEAPIIIEAKGYILIPVGFEFNLATVLGAPVKPGNPKMTDSLKFVDLYDIDIEIQPIPVNLDGLIDDLDIQDVYDVETLNAVITAEKELIDEVDIVDVYDTKIIGTVVIDEGTVIDEVNVQDVYDVDLIIPPVPVNLDGIIEELIYEDIHAIDIVSISKLVDPNIIESIDIQDIYKVDIQAAPFSGEAKQVDNLEIQDVYKTELINTTIIDNKNIESLSFDESNTQDIKSITRTDTPQTEDVGFTDFVNIEK